ncbi:hypothetical protein DES45_11055 [Microvirga subterranea]|uniref:Uncharacterized protein n=1 Tax=Microvirga subterranea TaxID=186651 RepID=A0A370HCZ6_9HYPH|nr:hypothetical protein [Microvirga subterranea]RDI55111.1 hypothetical protein DES45_11055 [Microvirga subterranea]
MDAPDDGSAALVVLDDVELPQRPVRIERACGLLRHETLQLVLAARIREPRARDVARDIETRVVDPIRRAGAALDPLPEAVEPQKAGADDALEEIEIDGRLKLENADDLHEVVGPIHAQPRRIHCRHAFGV